MKKIASVLSLVLFFLVSFQINAQWQITNCPLTDVPNIGIVAYHPDGYLFALTNEKELFRSINSGLSWDKITTLPVGIGSISVGPNGDLFGGTVGGYLFSTDHGISWQQREIFFSDGSVSDIEFSSNFIFISQSYGYSYYFNGVWISTDGGISWNKSTSGLNGEALISITKDSFGNIYTMTDMGQIFKSTNNGQTWELKIDLLGVGNDIEIDSNNNIYAASNYSSTVSTGIYKSTDLGNTWVVVSNEMTFNIFIDNNNNIYTHNYDILKFSSDGGNSWENLNFTGSYLYDVIAINDTIFIATQKGLQQSVDLGISWALCFRYSDRFVNVNDMLALSGDKLLIGTSAGLFLVENNFSSWDSTSITKSVNLIKTDNMGNAYTSADYLYRSTDVGLTWQIPYNIVPNNPRNVQDIFINDSGYVFTIQYNGLPGSYALALKSTDFGLTWNYMWDYTCACNASSVGYSIIEDYSGTLFLSYYFSKGPPGPLTDVSIIKKELGGTWTTVYDWKIANNMYLYNQALYMATNGYSSSQSLGVIKSTDNGNTFIQLNNGLTNLNIIQLILKPGIFIALTGNGIFCSLDEGNYWTPFNLSGLNANINSVYLDNNQTLYACTDNGIYVYTGILNVEDEVIPTKFVLPQNYPNPFNPSTKISWQSPVGSWQTLKIYDILGNEVATLVNEYRSAGSYEIDFNASHLASGIYYYQLRAGDYVETKKMILLK